MTSFPATQIPVYFINLAARPERRQFMEQQFQRLGIVAERIDAVTAAGVGDARMAPHAGSANPWAMARIEVACVMSHEQAWRRMLQAGQPYALILEDDVVLGDGLPAFLDPSLSAEIGADVLKLETMYRPVRLGGAARIVAGRFRVCQLLASHLGTAAYIISAEMARRTLADPRLHAMSADRYLFSRDGPTIPSRGVLQVDPAPAVQLEFYRGEKPETETAAASSDLKQDRDHNAGAMATSLRARWTDFLAQASYSLRLAGHILPDAEARRQKRRPIPFEMDV